MISALMAAVLTVWAAELEFDVDDTAYWRRWLGTRRYLWRRVLLALVPATVGVGVSLAVEPATTIANPYVRGVVAATLAWAILRADTDRGALKRSRTDRPEPDVGTSVMRDESGQAMSALVLVYVRVRDRLAKRTGRMVDADLARQCHRAFTAPDELVTTAQELASHLRQIALRPDARKRDIAVAEGLQAVLYEHMDVVLDPYADLRQRRAAAFTLAEVVAEEFKQRRWSRPAPQQTEEER